MKTTLTKQPKEVNEGSLLTLKNNIVHAEPIGMYHKYKEFSDLQAYLDKYSGQEHFLVWLGAWLMHNYLQQHINHNAEMLDMVRECLAENADGRSSHPASHPGAKAPPGNEDYLCHALLAKMDEFNTEES